MNRTTRSTLAGLSFIATLAACSGVSPRPASGPTADIILTNASVRTSDGWAEAISIGGGRILSVGTAEFVALGRGTATQVVDLNGKVVLPGFHDQHVHPIYGGSIYSGADHTNCRIEQGASLARLLEALASCVKRVSASEWVTGGQWDASALGVPPHRSLIDEVTGDVPVLLVDTSGHSAWANTRALSLAGITSDTPAPEGGIVERAADGQATGVLRESAIELVRRHVPPPSEQTVRRFLEWSLTTMLSYGITSYTEASNGFIAGAEQELRVYRQLADDGGLKQRVRVCLTWSPLDPSAQALIDARAQYERDRLTIDCIKIFLDGVPTDSHTAAMLDPYAGVVAGRDDDASRHGLLLIEQATTDSAVTRFDAQGLTVKFHAAGDAAVRSGLDAIEAARRSNGMSARRHDVGHCTFVAPDDVGRGRALNATFELSPYLWSPSAINDDIAKAVGPERVRRAWPFRELLDAGDLVVAGSDWAVVPSVNPWLAVESLVTRRQPGGGERAFGEQQAISVAEAIDLFTVNAARHMGIEASLGRLAPGFLADLIVVDRNPYDIPPEQLHEVRVLMTYIEGEKVYDAILAKADSSDADY